VLGMAPCGCLPHCLRCACLPAFCPDIHTAPTHRSQHSRLTNGPVSLRAADQAHTHNRWLADVRPSHTPGTRLSRSWALRSSPSLPTLRRSCTASKALVARHAGPALLQPGATPWQPCQQGWTPVFVSSRPPDTWPAAARAPQAGGRGPAAAPCALLRAQGGPHGHTLARGARWRHAPGRAAGAVLRPPIQVEPPPQAPASLGNGSRCPCLLWAAGAWVRCWSGMRASPFIV
jgi:hypothetical protein